MRKIFIFLTPLLIFTILFLLAVLIINKEGGKGALQVTSVPQSQVFLDDKLVGKTPLCLCELPELLKAGDYNIKLVPTKSGFKSFGQKITLYKGVLTVVDRTFDSNSSASSGSIITLTETDDNSSELLIISFPGKASVLLDSSPEGVTPLLIKNVTVSDHEIKILKDGYKEKIIKIKTILGKRLELTLSLGIKIDTAKTSATTSASIISVIVLNTPTGFLRVREVDSLTSTQIATVSPGEKLDFLSERGEWFEIRLSDGRIGWISSTYARKE